MIKIYGMPSCPDCAFVDEQAKGNANYEIIDIGRDVRALKEFLRMRDTSTAFHEAKQNGSVGIPCFILNDGSITLSPQDAGLTPRPADGSSCSLTDKSSC